MFYFLDFKISYTATWEILIYKMRISRTLHKKVNWLCKKNIIIKELISRKQILLYISILFVLLCKINPRCKTRITCYTGLLTLSFVSYLKLQKSEIPRNTRRMKEFSVLNSRHQNIFTGDWPNYPRLPQFWPDNRKPSQSQKPQEPNPFPPLFDAHTTSQPFG